MLVLFEDKLKFIGLGLVQRQKREENYPFNVNVKPSRLPVKAKALKMLI